MTLVHRVRLCAAAFAAAAAMTFAVPALAQDVSETHLKAAREAISALHATDQFDSILPQAAAALKAELIQKNPNLQELILTTVDEKTLAMVSRRADLEKEIAPIYARIFSEEDLKGIAAFYNSAPGKKLLSDGPIVTREVVKSAEIWQRGVARDLAQTVGAAIEAKAPEVASPAVQAPVTPADGAETPKAGEGAGGSSN